MEHLKGRSQSVMELIVFYYDQCLAGNKSVIAEEAIDIRKLRDKDVK